MLEDRVQEDALTPADVLVTAAAVLAKGVVHAIDTAGTLRATRAAALDLLDSAGRAIGKELRRRG